MQPSKRPQDDDETCDPQDDDETCDMSFSGFFEL